MKVVENDNLYYKRNKIEKEVQKEETKRRKKARARSILAIIFLLLIISLLNMMSASFYTIYTKGMGAIAKHFIFIIIGMCCFIITTKKIDYRFYNKNKVCGFFMITAIVIFLFIIIGSQIGPLKKIVPHINGAIGWIRIGGFSIQPAEFMKIPFIIIIAHFLEKCEVEKYSWKKTLGTLLPVVLIFVFLIILQKDLGTSIHYMGIFAFMLFLSRIPMKIIVSFSTLMVVSAGSFFYYVNSLSDVSQYGYKIKRVKSFLNGLLKNEYDNSIGYQVGQSLIAFGSGGVAGKGYANGVQKYSYLPEIRTDFILASFGEEFGFLGILILLIFFLLIFNIIKRTAIETKDYFGKYLAIGIGGYIIIQVLINIYVAIGLVPVFGIPMPLFSYGGTSIITVLSAIGIIININKKG